MKNVLDRFLEYVTFDTQSNETTGTHPSTSGQSVFARKLAKELTALHAENVRVTKHAYVFAELSASPGCESAPVLGFIAHMDTSDAASGKDVKPHLIHYQGGIVPLGKSGKTLDPAIFPAMNRQIGHTLIVTDGTTLLGADDKAGIAEIMTALERIVSGKLPHGPLRIAFTPDEEIGEGTLFFNTNDFGADYAYTIDGGAVDDIEYQNFNAAFAEFQIEGFSVHPGAAKNIMINALKIAMELNSMLPEQEAPEHTEGFEGFYHLSRMSGTAAKAESAYLLRDHDAYSFEMRRKKVEEITEILNKKYGKGTVNLALRGQYRNMEEVIKKHPFLIEIAQDAVRKAGLTPTTVPVRGGTDGAMLSWDGLPCPNLGTGGYNIHGEYEYASVQEMESSVQVILNIAEAFSRR